MGQQLLVYCKSLLSPIFAVTGSFLGPELERVQLAEVCFQGWFLARTFECIGPMLVESYVLGCVEADPGPDKPNNMLMGHPDGMFPRVYAPQNHKEGGRAVAIFITFGGNWKKLD